MAMNADDTAGRAPMMPETLGRCIAIYKINAATMIPVVVEFCHIFSALHPFGPHMTWPTVVGRISRQLTVGAFHLSVSLREANNFSR